MSLNGKLEDVSLSDVMQFVHLGRRTGTLSLTQGRREAEIGFHRGQIVSAWAPGTKPLAELLVEVELVTREAMGELLHAQQAELPRRSLGQVLVSSGTLDFDAIRAAIEGQIEQTIYDLVTWTTGSFEFALDELKPIDDIAMYPGDVIPKLNLNTQMVLLEAARILDEKNRPEDDRKPAGADRPVVTDPTVGMPSAPSATRPQAPAIPQAPKDERMLSGESMELQAVAKTLEGLDIEIPMAEDDQPEAAHRRLQIVSPDRQIAEQVREIILPEVAQVVRVPLREAGNRLPGEPSPTVVVLDMRDGGHSVDDLLAIRRSRPRSSVIALIDSQEMTTKAFDAGSVAAIPANPGALAACFHSLIRNMPDGGGSSARASATKAGFTRLRRVLADIRSGLLSATMALNLMHIISESVERAVLFLVRKDDLVALGAFGFSAQGKPLAEMTRSLRISLSGESVLSRCVSDGQPRSTTFDKAQLPAELAELLGRPYNGQVVVFPVLGAERVISVVDTDNGSSNRAIEDIELLELATAQVGVAFENELLRRQIESR